MLSECLVPSSLGVFMEEIHEFVLYRYFITHQHEFLKKGVDLDVHDCGMSYLKVMEQRVDRILILCLSLLMV